MTTIEPTDEMRAAFDSKLPRGHVFAMEDDELDACLAAVLAIVERDYRIEPRPPWDRCTCDPEILFDPPSPIPVAVEGCPAHRARRAAQQYALLTAHAAPHESDPTILQTHVNAANHPAPHNTRRTTP